MKGGMLHCVVAMVVCGVCLATGSRVAAQKSPKRVTAYLPADRQSPEKIAQVMRTQLPKARFDLAVPKPPPLAQVKRLLPRGTLLRGNEFILPNGARLRLIKGEMQKSQLERMRYSEDRAAFEQVLSYARPPAKDEGGERAAFLFLVWLHKSDPKYGCKYSLAENGRDTEVRILYDWAIQGGDQTGQDDATCRELQAMTSLPGGLPGPYSVPYGRILIVGLRHGQKWQVRYYDRQNLPNQVQTITRLTKRPYN